ncbi:MAG: ribonuclease PH [Deltaproteobacteria bacterium]|nr:ribonuclease PH [Deltaproteobacteria bacterium]
MLRRQGGRKTDELRPIRIEPHYLDFAPGSALVTWGRTRVLCAATVQEQAPPFRQHTGGGWVTAEYAMLPPATHTRQSREGPGARPRGRSQEIQRLIGRSLRAVVDLEALGERTVVLDCDVLQADGGTRAAAISGAFVALCLALEPLRRREVLEVLPVTHQVAAVSLGVVEGELLLDLDYDEDSRAEVDANFVATGRGDLVEVQASAEAGPFPPALLPEMLALALTGIGRLALLQQEVLSPWLPVPW